MARGVRAFRVRPSSWLGDLRGDHRQRGAERATTTALPPELLFYLIGELAGGVAVVVAGFFGGGVGEAAFLAGAAVFAG